MGLGPGVRQVADRIGHDQRSSDARVRGLAEPVPQQ